MPASVIGIQGMFQGFVVDLADGPYPVRKPRPVNSTDTKNIGFGETLVLNANNTYSSVAQFIANGGTFTANTPFAIAKSNVIDNQNTFSAAGGLNLSGGFYSPASQACDALVDGASIYVFCNNGTPTAGGTVYLRIALNASIPAGVIGGLEAAADGANNVAISNLAIAWSTGIANSNGDNTYAVTILQRRIA
jgi:hypothetical protein